MHDYSGVTGKVTVSGTIVGWVKASFKFEYQSGDYIEIGSEIYDHTKGPKKITGTLEKAWGIDTDDIYNLVNNRTEFNIEFEAVDGSSGVEKYVASGCLITGIEGDIEAGSDGALILNYPFKARDFYAVTP